MNALESPRLFPKDDKQTRIQHFEKKNELPTSLSIAVQPGLNNSWTTCSPLHYFKCFFYFDSVNGRVNVLLLTWLCNEHASCFTPWRGKTWHWHGGPAGLLHALALDGVVHYTESGEWIPAKLNRIESFSSLASNFLLILIPKPEKWLPLVLLSRSQKTSWWCWQQRPTTKHQEPQFIVTVAHSRVRSTVKTLPV